MSAIGMEAPAATTAPLSRSVPAVGRVVIVTAVNPFGGTSSVSLNPKSLAANA